MAKFTTRNFVEVVLGFRSQLLNLKRNLVMLLSSAGTYQPRPLNCSKISTENKWAHCEWDKCTLIVVPTAEIVMTRGLFAICKSVKHT